MSRHGFIKSKFNLSSTRPINHWFTMAQRFLLYPIGVVLDQSGFVFFHQTFWNVTSFHWFSYNINDVVVSRTHNFPFPDWTPSRAAKYMVEMADFWKASSLVVCPTLSLCEKPTDLFMYRIISSVKLLIYVSTWCEICHLALIAWELPSLGLKAIPSTLLCWNQEVLLRKCVTVLFGNEGHWTKLIPEKWA